MREALPAFVWRTPPAYWLVVVVALVVVSAMAGDAVTYLFQVWRDSPEYSHGFLLPLIALFLVWQRKDALERLRFQGAWMGVALTLLGFAVFVVGKFALLYALQQYALVLVLAGLVLSFMGWQGFRQIWFAFLVLLLAVPLPNLILDNLSARLQLVSTELGVAVIRAFDISVHAEGNVIDLGVMKLQVVEACNGLRYLFPLMTLGLVAANFFQAPMWKRAVLFLSSIPIAIIMNSLRVALIAVMAEYAGVSLAEGFLHDFEGWAMFAASLVVMLFVMWLLVKVDRVAGRVKGKDAASRVAGVERPAEARAGLLDVLRVEWPEPTPAGAAVRRRDFPAPFVASALLVIAAAVALLSVPQRGEAVPSRQAFSAFPMTFGQWQGKEDRFDPAYLEQLKLTDYLLADYFDRNEQRVNLYLAYYASQRRREESIHSPGLCIPRGGWEISGMAARDIDIDAPPGGKLRVNRLVIAKGEDRQLLYYWFQQRGRTIASEYEVKWYLFWDAMTRNRTDGALVRVTMPLKSGQRAEEADAALEGFVREMAPLLSEFVPS